MKKIVKEVLNEDFEENEDFQGPFIDDDGWDQESLTDVGLMDWLDKVQRLTYEINSARRGSYGVDGDTAEDLIKTLDNLHAELEEIVYGMKRIIEK